MTPYHGRGTEQRGDGAATHFTEECDSDCAGIQEILASGPNLCEGSAELTIQEPSCMILRPWLTI